MFLREVWLVWVHLIRIRLHQLKGSALKDSVPKDSQQLPELMSLAQIYSGNYLQELVLLIVILLSRKVILLSRKVILLSRKVILLSHLRMAIWFVDWLMAFN